MHQETGSNAALYFLLPTDNYQLAGILQYGNMGGLCFFCFTKPELGIFAVITFLRLLI